MDLCEISNRRWFEIQEATGVSEERAREMAEEIDEVFKACLIRNGYNNL